MSEIRHTPGPWTAYGSVVRTDEGRFIAKVTYNPTPFDPPMDDQSEATAQLIAAAPDLYEACLEAFEFLGTTEHKSDHAAALLMVSINKAIMKVEGR